MAGAGIAAASGADAQPSEQAPALRPVADPADDAARLAFARSLLGSKRTVRRRITIRGARVDYDTTLGAIAIEDPNGRPSAVFVYFAYSRTNGGGPARRPVTFAWGGGPSGPSTSFHFSSFGPRLRTEGADARFVDNPESILDRSDLVLVDPVGTGWTMPAGNYDYADFYSVAKDAASVGRFIRRYLQAESRTAAPLYLAGRSYGSVRLASVINHLVEARVPIAGAIPVAAAMDGNAFWESSGNMASFYLMLPNYAAIAWHHRRQARPAATVEEALAEAAEFALNDYLTALMNWPTLPADRRSSVLNRLHALTGISQDVWAAHRLRINGRLFATEFLRDRNMILQASDARNARPMPPPGTVPPTAPGGGGDSFVNAYVRDELNVASAPPYRGFAPGLFGSGPASRIWPVDRRGIYDLGSFKVTALPNFLDDVAEAMRANPAMRVQQHSGIYDLQSTSFPANWSLANMNIPDALRRNVEMFDYRAGHTVYGDDTERGKFLRNVATLYPV